MFQNRLTGTWHGNGEPQIVLSVGRVARAAPATRGAADRFETSSKSKKRTGAPASARNLAEKEITYLRCGDNFFGRGPYKVPDLLLLFLFT